MAINKILDKNKNVILDLTADTVDSTHLAAGYTAHNKNGQIVIGTMESKDIIMRGEPIVTFYDYDGNIVYEYTKEEFLALDELPPLPELTEAKKQSIKNSYASTIYSTSYLDSDSRWPLYYLIDHIHASRWSNTLAELKSALTNGMDGAQVAALYDTEDDCTYLVCINNYYTNYDYKYFRLYFTQSVSHGVEVDWGDGTVETFANYGTDSINAQHEYDWYGRPYRPYIIKLKVLDGDLGFGYRRARDKTTGEYVNYDYGNNSPTAGNSYWGIGAWFGKNVKFGYVQSSSSWGTFRSILGGIHNVEMDQTWSYSKNGDYLYCSQPVIVPHNSWVHRPERAAGMYWYKSSAGKVVIPVNYDKPQNIRTDSYGWIRPTSENMANYFGSKIYLPLTFTNGSYMGYYNTNTSSYMPRYIYPPNFKPECAYACANQGDVFTQLKVVGYLQDGIPSTATGCFARTNALEDFTCAYNADYPTLPDNLFEYCQNLTSIIFEDGTKTIPSYICRGCSKLSYVYIPSSVITINNGAFESTNSYLIVEIEPATANRTYNGSWMYNSTNARIYYNGTWDHWINEMLYGNQPANYQGIAYLVYVLDETGDVEYKGRTYKRLIDCDIPEDFVLPAHKEVVSLSWLSYFPNIKNLIINSNTALTTISQMPYYSACILDGVYFDGAIGDWLGLRFSNSDEQSSNPMSCAEHLYVCDGTGTIEKNGKYYREVTEIIVPVRASGSNIYVDSYKIHGYNGGVHKLIVPYGTTHLSSYAIRFNNAVKEIELPSTITRFESQCLAYNRGLWQIDIPESTTYMSDYVFNYCYSLVKVNLLCRNMPSMNWGTFYECGYHVYEIENHTNINLMNYVGSSSYGYLCYNLKHVTTSSGDESYVKKDAYGNILYDNGTNKYFMGYAGIDGKLTYPAQMTGWAPNNRQNIWLDNNVKEIIVPDKQSYTTGNVYLNMYYHVEKVTLGNMFTSTFNLPSYKLKQVIKNSVSTSPFYRYSSGQNYYTWPLGETYTIGTNVTSLSQALTTESFGCKQLIIEPSDDILNWNFQANYNTFVSIDSDVLDFTARPINVNYGNWMFYQGYSYRNQPNLRLKTLKLNCGSNFYNSEGYGLFYFVQDIDKVILSGTGLTSINYYLFRGDMPNFKWLELPESLTSITGRIFAQFPIDHNFTVTFKTVTPPTMTSNLMTQSNISDGKKLTFRVPQGSLEAYSTATNWPTTTQINYIEYDPVTGEDIEEGE